MCYLSEISSLKSYTVINQNILAVEVGIILIISLTGVDILGKFNHLLELTNYQRKELSDFEFDDWVRTSPTAVFNTD